MPSNNAHAGLEGRWKSILEAAGFEPRTLSGRNIECPFCGGKDRFRFDDKNEGMFFCTKCGPGDGFRMLMLQRSIGFSEALKLAREYGAVAKQEIRPGRSDEAKRKSIDKLWKQGHYNDERLADYLESRAIPRYMAIESQLKFHPEVEFKYNDDSGKQVKGAAPAILARFWTEEGGRRVATIQRHWLDAPVKKMVMPPCAPMNAVYCPLAGMPDDVLAVAEGVYTALSYRAIVKEVTGHDVVAWAAYSAESLKNFVPPEGVKRLHILADIDVSYTGQVAAYELARRLRITHPDLATRVMRPSQHDGQDFDFNDLIQLRKSQREQVSQKESSVDGEREASVQLGRLAAHSQ